MDEVFDDIWHLTRRSYSLGLIGLVEIQERAEIGKWLFNRAGVASDPRGADERASEEDSHISENDVFVQQVPASALAGDADSVERNEPKVIHFLALKRWYFTPAEGTTYRFAKEDRRRFPDILQAGTSEHPYYTNSSQLPVGFTDDPFDALERQDDLQRKYTGGTVLHLYMSETLSSARACRDLVRRALTRFRLPYITITPTFSICPKHGYLSGRHDFCPTCDAEILARKQLEIA